MRIDGLFGHTADGQPVREFVLENRNGLRARLIEYGATLVALEVPDRHGLVADVVLGFDDVAGYESDANQYFGCTTGRVCNRIGGAEFTLDGRTYRLAANDGRNHLHGGGPRALSKVVWQGARTAGFEGAPAVEFRYASPAGEEGYPGTLTIRVVYTLTEQDELHIAYEATTDAATPVNLTNHAYWNLSGHGSPTVLDHELSVRASNYTVADDELIPTGQIAPVANTPLDFRTAKSLRADLAAVAGTAAGGFDHNLVLDGWTGALRAVARLHDPASGRSMQIVTTEPGLQLYSGNFLKGQVGKAGRIYEHRSAVCLETQHFPDSVHHESFPSIILRPGEVYRSTTVHRFTNR